MPESPVFATIYSQQADAKGSNTRRPSACFVYGLQNFKRGQIGDEKIDGWLVLVHGTVKYLVGRFNVDTSTRQRIWNCALESYI